MEQFNPDAFIQANSGAPAGVSNGVDPTQLEQFDPDDFIKQGQIANAAALQDKHGSAPQTILAGIEAVARGGTLGTSDYLETATGASTPEAIQGRMAANPTTAFLGNIAGAGMLTLATGGFGGLASGIEAGVGGLAGRALGTAAEGAIFGAGNVVSDAALGDPHLNAQKVLSDIGMGAALGGGLGVLSKAVGALPALIRRGKGVPDITPIGEQVPVVDVTVPKGKKPTSLEEMQAAVDQAKKYGGQDNINELPQMSEAKDAESRVGPLMQFRVHDMQMDSLASQDARNEFKTMLEVPGKNGETLRNYQGAQKKELIGMMDNAIDNEVAPGYHPTTNAVEAGERAAQSFTDQIEKTRSELGPAFEKIKSTPLQKVDHLPGVIDYLTNPEVSSYANPKIAQMFDTSGDSIALKPYSTSMGIDGATYRSVKQAIEALKENPEDFEKLFDIRKGLSQHVDVTKLGDAPKEISSAKAAMMDYIQDAVQTVNPDQAVRDIFKKWAVNEQNAAMIEKRFGAEIGSNNWRSLAKGGDEGIIKKIFRDSDSVAAAKAILPKEDFNNMLADHLSIMRNDATDKGIFSSNKFFSNFRRNQYSLGEAFSENAPTFQKIKDSLTLMRIFADDIPQNPSGTTKTLLQALMQGGLDPFKHISNLMEFGKDKFSEAVKAQQINEKLAGTADAAKKLGSLQGILNRVNSKLTSSAKSIFTSSGTRGAALAGSAYLSDAEYNKLTKDVRGYYANPQSFIDDMADNSHHLYQAAPGITQGIHNAMAQAVQFLNSKLPQATSSMPLSPEWKPSESQKARFNRYYQAVNDPLHALKQVKNGTLSHETIEALQAVHPQFLQEARQKVMEHMDIDKTKKLPYAQRLALSKFLGQPLDTNMTPRAIQSNQMAFSIQNQKAQQEQQQGRSTLGGLKELKFGTRAETQTRQDIEDL